MLFATPAYLFGILGLIVPILIHLWSRKESSIQKIGSIKFLPESETSRSSSVQLNEKFLLLLRCLLLGVLSLLLADLLIERKDISSSKLILIEPSLLTDSRVKRALDSLPTDDVRLFQKGFPVIEGVSIDSSNSNSWALIADAESLNADSLVIFAEGNLNELEGKRPAVSKEIEWINVDRLEAKKYIHRSIRLGEEQLAIGGISDANVTSYEWVKSTTNELPSESWDTLHVAIFNDTSFERDKIYVKAAFKSVEQLTKRPLAIREYNSTLNLGAKELDWLVWLSENDLVSNHSAKSILRYRPDSFEPLISGGSYNYHLNQRLNSRNVLEGDLAGRLLNIAVPQKEDDQETRQVSISQLTPRKIDKAGSQHIATTSANQWLWMLLLIILCFERFYSFKRAM